MLSEKRTITKYFEEQHLASYAFLALHANEIEGDSNNERIRGDDETCNIS